MNKTNEERLDYLVEASAAYSDFLKKTENLHVLYLELGVGSNTPVIIKYPFWQNINSMKFPCRGIK